MSLASEFEYDVFISYSSHDKQWVCNDLLRRIEGAGFRAFIDFRDFARGAPSIKEMERGVVRCRKTLLILTPAYIESAWCEIETIMLQTLSPANQDLRLIPLLKSSCNKPLRIGALTHIDFTENADLDLAWAQLLGSLAPTTPPDTLPTIPLEIRAELDRAKMLMDVDKHSEAIPILEAVLPLADATGRAAARVKVRLSLAHALYDAREDFNGAERLYRDALALVPGSDLDLRHSAVHGLANMLLLAGRLDEAKAAIDVGLEIARRAGKTEDIIASLISLGLLEQTLGFHERASATLDQALQLLFKRAFSIEDELGKKTIARDLAICYLNKAQLCHADGNSHEALAFVAKAEEQQRISGDKLDAGRALLFCGSVHCSDADWEQGFDCFVCALELFKEIANPLWGARSLEHISRVYATHEDWDKALQAMLAAAAGAAEAGNPGEQVHFLCSTAKLLREWKTKGARNEVSRMIHRVGKHPPDADQPRVFAQLSKDVKHLNEAIDKAVREDKQVRDALKRAKEIAEKAHLQEHLANCLLDEAYNIAPPEAVETRHALVTRAIALLTEKLQQAQSPTRRGHLMCRISGLYRELDNETEALTWLRRAGELFEKSGNAFDLANFHASLAELYHAEGRLDDEIAAGRQVLAIIRGRSFHRLAAGARINLAAALRYRKEFSEALTLLTEAEAIANRHHYNDAITAIARNRSSITAQLEAAQAPSITFSGALDSLRQLITYKPELAEAYLAFWSFAWGKELLALLRAGPHVTFMVVTDDVEKFLAFASMFRQAADYFVMATSTRPTVEIATGVLPIPPLWLFPASFPILAVQGTKPTEPAGPDPSEHEDDDIPLEYEFVGPATMLPPYIMVDNKSSVPGEGGVMALSMPSLPPEAIDLMLRRPMEELLQRRALWVPLLRLDASDVLLNDLGWGYVLGILPVYFHHMPMSRAVTVYGGVQVSMPRSFLNGEHDSTASKWKRSLLKLVTLTKDDAQTALLSLPDLFAETEQNSVDAVNVEIRLFEFRQAGQRRCYPALLVRTE
jgi:tetratricopeptide (TPR) repeat protein